MGKLIDTIKKQKKARAEQEKKQNTTTLTPKLPSISEVRAKNNDKYGFSAARTEKSLGVQSTEELGLIDKIKREKAGAIVDRLNTWYKNSNNFMSNHQTRFSGLTGTYNDPYDSGTSDWLATVTEQKSRFDAEADSILSYLSANRDLFDEEWLNAAVTNLDLTRKQQDAILKDTEGYNKYWSQWETEDAYKRYQKIASISDMSSEQIKKYLNGSDPVAFTTDEGQNVTWEDLYNTKFYEELMGSDDFDEYSQIGASIENPSYAAANGSDNFLGWKNPFAKGEKIGNIVTFSRDNIEDITKAMGGANSNADLASGVGDYRYKYMTDDEVNIYNYYLGIGDPEKAAEYLAYLDEDLNARWGAEIAGRADSNAVSKLVFGLGAGLDQFVSGVQNLKSFVTGDEGIATTPTQFASSVLRENMGTGMGVAYDLAQTTGNMLPSILVGGVAGAAVGTASMGLSATGNAYSEMRKLGYDEWQARGYGALVGASEATLQYFLGGISKLGGKVTNHAISNIVAKFDNAIARVAISLGGNMISEGLEESIQSVLEPAFKSLVTGEGYNVDWEEVFYSGLLGALSAGLLEGVPTIAGNAIDSVDTSKYGKDYKKTYGADIGSALAGEAVELSPNSKFAQRMQAKAEGGKELSNRQVGKLVQQNETAMYENDAETIKSAAASRLTELGESGNVDVIASALTKQVTGERLTFAEREAVKSSKFGERVANELNPENIRGGGYSSAWAEKIGTDRINAAEYGRMIAELEHDSTTPKHLTMSVNPPEEPEEEAGATGSEDVGVKVKEISSVKDGKITVKLDSGEVVDASEVDFGNEDTALVYQAAAEMSQRAGYNEDTVKVLVNGFESSGLNAAEYLHAFRDSFNYGAAGTVSVSALEKGKYTSLLSEKQRELAFHLGKAFGEESAQRAEQERARIENEKTASAEKEAKAVKASGEVMFDGSVNQGSLSKAQKAQIKVLRGVSSAIGAKIRLFASEATVTEDGRRTRVFSSADGEAITANGWYDNETGEIWIDVNAGVDGNGLILFTAAHELTHFIKDWSSEKYNAFANFLISQYAENGVSVDELIEAQIEKAAKRGREMTREEAFDEVVADSCESFLTDSNAAEKIAALNEKDATLAEKIKSYIHKLLVKIRNLLKGIDPDSEEGKIVRGMTDSLEKLYELWTDALADAGQSYPIAHGVVDKFVEGYKGKGKVKYSERDFASQVDAVLSGADTNNSHLKLMETPALLQKAGLPNLPILMTAKHLKTITSTSAKGKANYHGLDVEIVKKLPEHISDPVMMADSLTREDSIVIITEAIDSENRPVIAAIMLNGKGALDDRYIDANIMTSAYGKNNFQSFLDRIADNNAVIYWDEKKSRDLSVNLGLQLPNIITSLDSGTIIHPAKAFVNSKSKKFSERDTASARAAVSEFGTTSDFSHAGFAIFDGRMLKLSQYGQAGVKHRNIERIYADTKGDGAIARFIQEGNVRISAASPGVEMSADIAPTVSQLNTISRFISNSLRNRGVFYLDITDSKGENAVSIAYDEDASTSDIVYDIKDYYERGRIPQRVYSERDSDAISSREVLANALESTVQNDIEAERLAEYKSKIAKFDAEEQKLRQLRAEIKELSFAPGKRDNARLAELRTEAEKTANRINIYDKQLLRLEASKPLEGILQREKQKAYKKAKADAKAQKEKAAERHDKTTMRHKIRERVDSFNKLLLNPTKEKHIPMNLQKPVAELLAVINMESSDNENMKSKLLLLKSEYDAIAKSNDPIIAAGHHPEVAERIGFVAEEIGDTRLKDMNLEQLDYLYETLTIVDRVIRDANKGFKIAKGRTIADYSMNVMSEIQKVGGRDHMSNDFLDGVSRYRWANLKPVYAFERIGSDTFTELFNNVRNGEDVWARDISEARTFFLEQTEKHGFYDWDMKETRTFEGKFGKKFDLTLQQMMSLYAYSKRAQADKHLEDGGFVFEDAVTVTKKKYRVPIKYTVKIASPHSLASEHIAAIIGSLTDSQRAFVDEMQAYLSDTMGAKGNEVSREMYGIDLFKEKYYFPIKSSNYYMNYNPEKDAQARIKNYGMAKETVKNANNPIVLSDFMDVWANHVDEMSMYHAFVLPMEDFSKVFNFNTDAGGNRESIQQSLVDAYGDESVQYIKNLLTDLNGGARSDPNLGIANKLVGRFKKAKVFLSASVVIQQPSAIGRAFAVINPKYFTPNFKQKRSAAWEELKKYAPVATIKEMGYFDTNVGQSTVDYLTGRDYNTLVEKIKGIATDKNYRDEAMGRLPALADELAWTQIWQACKNEIADTTNLKRNSEEFLTAAGKRFTEVVTKTQVYDSVLSRSSWMRSKDGLSKMLTAFLAEPTTSANMVGNAILQASRGNVKGFAKTLGAVATSVVLNSMLVSLVYAARDDDEDESFTEKYIESLVTELIEGVNPATYLPIIKDIWSVLQGYDVERSDMSLIADIIDALYGMLDDNKTWAEKIERLAASVADMTGLPLNNVLKDLRAAYRFGSSIFDDIKPTDLGISYAIEGAVVDSVPFLDKFIKSASKSDKLYMAITAGSKHDLERAESAYKTETSLQTAIKKGLRENDVRIKAAARMLNSGDIRGFAGSIENISGEGIFDGETVEAAIRAEASAFNSKIKDAAEAKRDGKTDDYIKIVKELRESYRGVYTQDEIVEAVNSYTFEDVVEDDVEEVESVYKNSDINAALESGDTETASEIIKELIEVKTENNFLKAQREAEESGKRFKEKEARTSAELEARSSIRSSLTNYWKKRYIAAYESGNEAEVNRISELLYSTGIYGNRKKYLDEVLEGWLEK